MRRCNKMAIVAVAIILGTIYSPTKGVGSGRRTASPSPAHDITIIAEKQMELNSECWGVQLSVTVKHKKPVADERPGQFYQFEQECTGTIVPSKDREITSKMSCASIVHDGEKHSFTFDVGGGPHPRPGGVPPEVHGTNRSKSGYVQRIPREIRLDYYCRRIYVY